jgi:hypothetical protein
MYCICEASFLGQASLELPDFQTNVKSANINKVRYPDPDPLVRGTDPAPDPSLFS